MNEISGNKGYGTYIAKYMGVGLIGGSVVHMGTLGGSAWYIFLACIGVTLMVLGNAYEAKQTGQKIHAKYFAIILCLSLATGFLTGGTQHYVDNPMYAGGLLAIGLFVSYVAYFLKEGLPLKKKNIAIALVVAMAIFSTSYVFVQDIITGLHATFEGSNAVKHTH